jgi:hypothetical protein
MYATLQSPDEHGYSIGDRFPNWLGDDFTCWADVLAEATAAFVGLERIPEQKLSTFLWSQRLEFPAQMVVDIPTLRDEIDAVLCGYCFKNEVYGRPSDLFSKILDVFEQGGWPCGWLGKYPEGKMIVLDPNPN